MKSLSVRRRQLWRTVRAVLKGGFISANSDQHWDRSTLAGEHLAVLSRVDIDRIQQQVGYPLEPVYVVQIRQGDPDLPVPLALPSFEDEGPHLAYAIQWFGFALILSIGSLLLVRRQRKRPSC